MGRYTVALSLIAFFFSCSQNKQTLFEAVSSDHSYINFTNQLTESEQFNIIEYLYFYNGGGVSVGDINNDGLADIYLSSNQGTNKLYLNKGDFRFEDITKQAGVEGKGNWKTGVTMADVNGDGLLDIYLCGVGKYKNFNGYNQLFINKGNLTFTEEAERYGLNFQGFSTQAAFFDYDLDGDLDMYLLNHSVHTERSLGKASLRFRNDSLAGDRMYRNDLAQNGSNYFTDITEHSGILNSAIGYGLGIGIADINWDGYPDIYVSNDFNENDYLYINQKNGKFLQSLEKSMPHTSRFSMGNDIADVNNDSWPDIVTLDMLPKNEEVIKTSAGEDSYEIYQFKLSYGYHKQVSRNTLQINQGLLDSGRVYFTDIAPLAGVEATDWSWCPLLADFNGDGLKDIFVSNGIAKRPNDLDYISFISNDSAQRAMQSSVLPTIKEMPDGRVSNFLFTNLNGKSFSDRSEELGSSTPSLSTGAAYGDLDNDGDLDLVINNINEKAFLYRNTSPSDRFLKISLRGDPKSKNPFGLGARILVTQDNHRQWQELFPTRGWCSSSDYALSFGLQNPTQPITVLVIWPDGQSQEIVTSKRHLELNYSDASTKFDFNKYQKSTSLLTPAKFFSTTHKEDDFNAFGREGLIPKAFTREGPPLAVGDVNKDGMDDVFVGGAKNQPGSLFLQIGNGEWELSKVNDFAKHTFCEDVDATFLDVDGDEDLDLVVVSGGHEDFGRSEALLPRLYLNDGKGKLARSRSGFPNIYFNASCVRPVDFDADGDIDLFIGSNVLPMLFGMSPPSYLFVNDGAGNFLPDPAWLGKSTFDNPTVVRPGMVNDAVWSDINKDGLIDIILVGEWMPITILIQNELHKFSNRTKEYGLEKTHGWWNTIAANDFDNDGDVDWVAGNFGLNSRLKASVNKPVRMFLGDFDSNGGSDHILVYYNGEASYPFPSRDQLIKQLPLLKKKFLRYKDYRHVKLEDIITPLQQGNSAEMKAELFESVMLENRGDSINVIPLPDEAQRFPVYSILFDDVNQDGVDDLFLGGNSTATQPELGPYDAGLGLILLSEGKGKFKPLTPAQSGFVVKGETRDIKTVRNLSNKDKFYVVSRNNDSVLAFKVRQP